MSTEVQAPWGYYIPEPDLSGYYGWWVHVTLETTFALGTKRISHEVWVTSGFGKGKLIHLTSRDASSSEIGWAMSLIQTIHSYGKHWHQAFYVFMSK